MMRPFRSRLTAFMLVITQAADVAGDNVRHSWLIKDATGPIVNYSVQNHKEINCTLNPKKMLL